MGAAPAFRPSQIPVLCMSCAGSLRRASLHTAEPLRVGGSALQLGSILSSL